VQQILINLVVNAIESVKDRNPEIIVKSESAQNYKRLTKPSSMISSLIMQAGLSRSVPLTTALEYPRLMLYIFLSLSSPLRKRVKVSASHRFMARLKQIRVL
jgi:hypothetical protein